MTRRLIDAEALLDVVDRDISWLEELTKQEIIDLITNAPTVQREVSLTYSKYKTVMQCLTKISEFCPIDKNIDQSDESPENHIRLSFAEIGDTARCAIATLIEIEPTIQREGWVSAFFEDDEKTVFCFEQYKPEHIVVVFDYAKGEFVQVIRPNADGTTSSKMYEPSSPKE